MAQMLKSPEVVLPDYSQIEKVPQLFMAAKNARRTQDRADRHAATQESYARLKEARDAELHRVALEKEERLERDRMANAGVKAYAAAQSGRMGEANLLAAANGLNLRTQPQQVEPLAPLPPAPVGPQFPEGAFEIPQEGSRGPVGQTAPGPFNAEGASRRDFGAVSDRDRNMIEGGPGTAPSAMAPEMAPDFPEVDQAGKREALRNYGNEQNRHLDAVDAHSTLVAQRPRAEVMHAEATRKAAANPQISIGIPGQPEVTFDQNEMENGRRAREAEQADGMMRMALDPTSGLDPQVRQMMIVSAMGKKAGISDKQAAPITGSQAEVQKQAGAVNLQGIKDKSSMERLDKTLAAKMKKASAGAGKMTDKALDLKLRIGQRYDAIVKEVQNQLGFKSVVLSNRKYNDLSAKLAADPNSALDATIAGEFVKMAQGGVGVVSDQDFKVFWTKIGSMGEQVQNWVENGMKGTMSDVKRRQVAEAVHELARGVRRSGDTALQAIEDRLSVEPGGKERSDNYKKVYGEASGASAATPQSAASGSAERRKLDDMSIEQLRELAK